MHSYQYHSEPIIDSTEIAGFLNGKKVVLGDQSPWAGGLLRAEAIVSELAVTPAYFFQDLDSPWYATSNQTEFKNGRLQSGWNTYWSLACRYPWSFSVPGAFVNNVVNATKSPHGLSYLIGPKTQSTIYQHNKNRDVLTQLKTMLHQEIDWASNIVEWSEMDCQAGKASEFRLGVAAADDIRDLVNYIASISDVSAVYHFFDFFKENIPITRKNLPEKAFWAMSSLGCRNEPGNKMSFYAPKARALILEIAARGWVLACTDIPYMEDVQRLRDEYLPELRIPVLHVDFNWQFTHLDPMAVILAHHSKKRLSRQQSPDNYDAGKLATIKHYWQRRPSSISYYLLGGELNPSFRLLHY